MAQDVLIQQLYKQPDTVLASVRGIEDISKRTKNVRHFRNGDGTWTAVVASDLNYDDGSGKLMPVLPELWRTNGGGWQMQAGPLTVKLPKTAKGQDVQHVYMAKDGTQHTFTLAFPNLSYIRDTTFSFSLSNLTWNLVLGKARTDFTAVVSSARGGATYSFDYDLKGAAGIVNPDGHFVGDDGATLTRPVMLRADGRISPCGSWLATNKTLSFTCDDWVFSRSVTLRNSSGSPLPSPGASIPFTAKPGQDDTFTLTVSGTANPLP